MSEAARAERLAVVIGGVLRHAVEDTGARGVIVLDAVTPEGALAVRWAERALGRSRVWVVSPELLKGDGLDPASLADSGLPAHEAERAAARVLAERRVALLAHPANRTVLMLSRTLPPEPLLPLGDLPASHVEALSGSWSAPPDVTGIVRRAGGVEVVDGVLAALLDRRQRREDALAALSAEARAEFSTALERGRASRRRIGIVPKLGPRTPGIDLFE